MKRETRLGGSMTNAIKSPHEIQMPGLPAEFSVGHYLESKFYLFCDKVSDGIIFNLFQVIGR